MSFVQTITTINNTVGITFTTSNINGSYIYRQGAVSMDDSGSTYPTDTLPSATDINTVFAPVVGQQFSFTYNNQSMIPIYIASGSGGTSYMSDTYIGIGSVVQIVIVVTNIVSPSYDVLIGSTNGELTGGSSSVAGQVFLTSGTSWMTPSDITSSTTFKITLIGGGGGTAGGSQSNMASSGGGAGGVGIIYLTGLSPSTSYTYAIGVAGSAGTALPSRGTSGGTTSIIIGGTTYSATGGSPGLPYSFSPGGIGGTSTNCTISITGQQGQTSDTTSTYNIPQGGNTGWNYGNGGNGVYGIGNGNTGVQGCILIEYY